MVNEAATSSERALALSYAPASSRAALQTLFALDARLRTIATAARDPTIGLMRLTWWAEALARLDHAPAPAEPLLRTVAAEVVSAGVTGADLAELADGWMRVVEGEPDLAAFATERGGRLFALAARLLGGADSRASDIGGAWALVDLGESWPAWREPAQRLAAERLRSGLGRAWPRNLRPLGALALLARFDLKGDSRPGSPRRVARLLAHRLTGR